MLEIIISYYNNFEFIKIIDVFPDAKITIYDKSDNDELKNYNFSNYNNIVEIKKIENIGRESETFLRHIIENYENLNDYTLFIQDDIDNHIPDLTIFKNITLESINEEKKFHHYKSTWRKGWDTYSRPVYNGNACLPDFFSSNAIPDVCNRFSISLPNYYITETCAFMLLNKNRILRKSKDFYISLKNWVLEDKNNGFILEHIWCLIFNYNLTKENIVEKITEDIKNNKPICYAKYGDGEYICANYGKMPECGNANCDNDPYTEKKQKGIIESFQYIVNNMDNTYIGAWESENVTNYWRTLVDEDKIKWAQYHTFIIGDEDFGTDQLQKKVEMYKAIQQSSLKKIIVCNSLLLKAKDLFKTDSIINVPFNNWFDSKYEEILNKVKNVITDEQPIIITACGMAAKILISDLAKLYPKGIFLDIGSALDYLCTKHDTRGRKYSYNDLYNIFKDILPDNWHHPSYEKIYLHAKIYLRNM